MTVQFTVDGLSLKETGQTLVGDWNCYESQLKARHAFNGTHEYRNMDTDSFYILNYAPTGGGKTMSWEDSVIRYNIDTLVLYPTNALSADQIDSIEGHLDNLYDKQEEIGTLKLTAPKLEQERRERTGDVGNNGELIATLIREKKREYESVIVFTNPDIFTNLRNNVYRNSFAKRLSELFEMIVVDEFHCADIAGQCSIINLIEQVRSDADARTTKCMLLSATPDDRIIEMLESSDAPVIDLTEGSEKQPHSEVRNDENYNTVLPPTNLELRRGQAFQVGDQLLSGRWRKDLLDFCQQDQRTVIMLDSRKEVGEVSYFLQNNLPRDIEVIQIDGGNNENLKQKLSRFNDEDTKSVMVSNSAVEVGIDFDTDQILFSGMNNSRMLQRFGRLRNREEKLNAIAYVPGYVYERVVNELEEKDSDVFTRSELRELLDSIYFRSRQPHSYPATFGSHEAYEQALRHAEQEAPETQHEVMERARNRIERLFLDPYNVEVDWDEFHDEHEEMGGLINTLMQYRSSGPSTLVYDTRQETIETEDIQSVLRTGNIEIVSAREFRSRVPNNDGLHRTIDRMERYTSGHIIYHGNEYQEKAGLHHGELQDREIYLKANGELVNLLNQEPNERLPTELDNVEIWVNERDLSPIDVTELNKELDNESPLVYPIRMEARDAQYEYDLDDFFFLTDIADGKTTGSSSAIGKNALYMYCIRQERLYRRNPDRDDLDIRIPDTIWDTGRL